MTESVYLYNAIMDVKDERKRRDHKWGPIETFDSRTPYEWLAILNEEQGELAEAVLKRDDDSIVTEATQVAAVALAILESQQRMPFGERNYGPTR